MVFLILSLKVAKYYIKFFWSKCGQFSFESWSEFCGVFSWWGIASFIMAVWAFKRCLSSSRFYEMVAGLLMYRVKWSFLLILSYLYSLTSGLFVGPSGSEGLPMKCLDYLGLSDWLGPSLSLICSFMATWFISSSLKWVNPWFMMAGPGVPPAMSSFSAGVLAFEGSVVDGIGPVMPDPEANTNLPAPNQGILPCSDGCLDRCFYSKYDSTTAKSVIFTTSLMIMVTVSFAAILALYEALLRD